MRKFRADSRITVLGLDPKYFTADGFEAAGEVIYNEHDRQEVLKLKVGEYYLNEYTRFTRVE